MAVLGTSYLNLADRLKRTENGKQAAEIIEMMNETNVVMQDANVVECNDGSNYLTTIRNGLPSVTFRRLYGFVPPSKSTTVQVKDPTGMMEAFSVVDKDLVDKAPEPKKFRLSESTPFIEAMNQTCQGEFFYGNTKTRPEGFDGLAVRYGTKSTDKKNIGYNIIDGGGTGDDNTSIWFVTHGDQYVSMTYPQGSKAGIQHTDDGVQTETNASGAKRKVYQDHYKMDVGQTLRDWRSTARIANIDVSDLDGTNAADLLELMRAAYYRINPYRNGGKTVIYCNTNLLMHFDRQVDNKDNIHFSWGEYLGEKTLHYKGIPIRACEQILDTEAVVS
jgi:hypothetical protein